MSCVVSSVSGTRRAMPDEPTREDAMVTGAIGELRALTTCRCRSEFALKNGHESER